MSNGVGNKYAKFVQTQLPTYLSNVVAILNLGISKPKSRRTTVLRMTSAESGHDVVALNR